MRQVLTIPPTDAKGKFRFWARLWAFIVATVPKLILFLPLVIYVLLTLNDVHTSREVGENISKTLTNSSLYSDYGFLVLILLFTIVCYTRWASVDKVWNDYWRQAQEEVASKKNSRILIVDH